MQVVCDGQLFTAAGIRSIQVQAGGGDDLVTYRLTATGLGTLAKALDINLGAGQDIAVVQVLDFQAATSLDLRIDGGSGDDQMGFRVPLTPGAFSLGEFLTPETVHIELHGGSGDNTAVNYGDLVSGGIVPTAGGITFISNPEVRTSVRFIANPDTFQLFQL